MYSNRYQCILNKIYLFKQQIQIELNEILKLYKLTTYENLEDYISNNINKLTNKNIEYLDSVIALQMNKSLVILKIVLYSKYQK